MPFGYGLWVFLKNNPAARMALAIGAGIAAFLVWLGLRDRRRDKITEMKIEIKAQEASRKVIDKAKEKTHETVREAEQARADIPRGTPSGELPKHVQDILFDD